VSAYTIVHLYIITCMPASSASHRHWTVVINVTEFQEYLVMITRNQKNERERNGKDSYKPLGHYHIAKQHLS